MENIIALFLFLGTMGVYLGLPFLFGVLVLLLVEKGAKENAKARRKEMMEGRAHE